MTALNARPRVWFAGRLSHPQSAIADRSDAAPVWRQPPPNHDSALVETIAVIQFISQVLPPSSERLVFLVLGLLVTLMAFTTNPGDKDFSKQERPKTEISQ
jgi:hypothetical protein